MTRRPLLPILALALLAGPAMPIAGVRPAQAQTETPAPPPTSPVPRPPRSCTPPPPAPTS
jgi:hypothetical protein